MKNIVTLALFISTLITTQAIGKSNNTACRIDVEIAGLADKKVTLTMHYGLKDIIVDTIKLDSKGRGYLERTKKLPEGIYSVVLPNGKYFELLIGFEQYFTIVSDTSSLVNNISIEGSDETDAFCKYQKLALQLEKVKKDKSNREKIQQSISLLKDSIYKSFDKQYISKYLKMQEEPSLKVDTSKMAKAPIEKFKQLHYLKAVHYFDNIDFSDVRLLNTRLFSEKLDYYFNVFISQQPDTIIQAMDKVMKLAKSNDSTYRFTLSFMWQNFRNIKTPNDELVFVHLAENYYLNNTAPWVDKRFIKILEEKTLSLKKLAIGNIAPDLDLVDIAEKPLSLHKTNADLLLVLFWTPDCDNCTKKMDELNQIYSAYKSKGFKIFAIYTHADKKLWKEYLEQHSYPWIHAYDPLKKSHFEEKYKVEFTPKLILLDKNKNILAKDLSIEQLKKMLLQKSK
ncbi:MAG TPA: thioredoxin-like domain-containing protein [Bacteroidales bacterium]|nr:thioredoxin-like domain-containing protein [Bacteroidales bacterium]